MASTSDPPPTSNEQEEKSQVQSTQRLEEHADPRLAVARAAFAFRDTLDSSRQKKLAKPVEAVQPTIAKPAPAVNVQEVAEPPPAPKSIDVAVEVQKLRLARHRRNIRIARTVQHLLTSVLSLVIVILQSKILGEKPMSKRDAPATPAMTTNNKVPMVMLLATAVFAIFFDICSLAAYVWPQTSLGRKAFRLALQAHYILTTFKSVAYAYSTVACTGSQMGGLKMDVAMSLSSANVLIEVLGIVIDQYVKRDAAKFKQLGITSVEAMEMGPPTGDGSTDKQPLLPGYSFQQDPTHKIDDSDYDQLSSLGAGLDSDLQRLKPKIPPPQL